MKSPHSNPDSRCFSVTELQHIFLRRWKALFITTALTTCLLFAEVTIAFAQESLTGKWDGAIVLPGANLTIAVTFAAQGDSLSAKIDIPQQGAWGLPLKAVSFVRPAVHFELPAGPGLATFQGTLKGDSIRGEFRQATFTGSFFLGRTAATPPPKVEERLPYREEEVRFQNGDVTLAGTLTLPEGAGPFPAIVLLTGSGRQNRDEELFGFKPFRIIADHLTRKGIAVLRCDDRGVGGSSAGPPSATTADFADDGLKAVAFLMQHKLINPKEVGILGHSEGGIEGVIAASKSKNVAFLILMAGPSVAGEKIVLYQLETIGRAVGKSDAEIQTALGLQHEVFSTVRAGKGWDELTKKIANEARTQIEQLPSEQRGAITNIDSLARVTAEQQLRTAQTPWFKFFAEFDPASALKSTKCPVLALFGERDVQVPVSLNKEPLEHALRDAGNPDVTTVILPEANHLFIPAVTGQPSEYASLKKEFVPAFLQTISDWLLKRVAAPAH